MGVGVVVVVVVVVVAGVVVVSGGGVRRCARVLRKSCVPACMPERAVTGFDSVRR